MIYKPLAVLLFLLPLTTFGRIALGWSDYDHQAMVAPALKEIADPTGLSTPCVIRPISSFLEKIRSLKPEIQSQQDFSKFLLINPSVPLNSLSDEEVMGGSIKPVAILRLHSIDPDDGRDQNLETDFYRDQVWFGSGTGVNSQAFRHIEKPPFNPFHFNDTFGFPLRQLGQASRRAQTYYDLALLARSWGEEYWAWRFLASSFHYLQDLHQPFHAAQVSPEIASLGLRSYFLWGKKEKFSIIGTISRLVSNLHLFFEDYTTTWTKRGRLIDPLCGTQTEKFSTVQDYAIRLRDRSNRLSSETSHLTRLLAKPILLTSYKYPKPEDQAGDFVRSEDKDFQKNLGPLFKIVEKSFHSAGIAMRSVVTAYQKTPKEQDAEKLLREIEQLR
ncbi:MAG: hypothetical protein HYS22_03875 [Deltaproteobacteria bacterium]|nr:hypothetical protein [Deltaproteobacteria bacterium]